MSGIAKIDLTGPAVFGIIEIRKENEMKYILAESQFIDTHDNNMSDMLYAYADVVNSLDKVYAKIRSRLAAIIEEEYEGSDLETAEVSEIIDDRLSCIRHPREYKWTYDDNERAVVWEVKKSK